MGKPTLPLMSKYYVIPAEAGIQRGRGEGRANHTPLSLSDGELKGVSTAPVIPRKPPSFRRKPESRGVGATGVHKHRRS